MSGGLLPALGSPLALMRSHRQGTFHLWVSRTKSWEQKQTHELWASGAPAGPEEQTGPGEGVLPRQPGNDRVASEAPFLPTPTLHPLLLTYWENGNPLTTCPLTPPAEDTPGSNC